MTYFLLVYAMTFQFWTMCFSSNLLWAVVLRGTGLQKDGGGTSISVGGAPLYAPPLHP